MRRRSTHPRDAPRRPAPAIRSNGWVPVALRIVLIVIVFGPLIVFGGFLVWAAIQDGRDERRSKRVTRG